MIVTGELWGYLSIIWCVAMLAWNLFRNNTVPALIYEYVSSRRPS